mmetsp:Transcript_31074/g.30525  ORF Transcript_31074/g.30525 Transcript_31074/m.30525 type:complete len:172 (-) Transcript_31074:1444-1959(-)
MLAFLGALRPALSTGTLFTFAILEAFQSQLQVSDLPFGGSLIRKLLREGSNDLIQTLRHMIIQLVQIRLASLQCQFLLELLDSSLIVSFDALTLQERLVHLLPDIFLQLHDLVFIMRVCSASSDEHQLHRIIKFVIHLILIQNYLLDLHLQILIPSLHVLHDHSKLTPFLP